MSEILLGGLLHGDAVRGSYGDDSTPLVSLVRDEPPGWGKLTSDRSRSAAYQAFVESARRKNKEREKK
mgnify:CR=1 FL=1